MFLSQKQSCQQDLVASSYGGVLEYDYDYYSLNQIIIKYDLPKDGTGLLASFLTKGGQVFEYSIINDDEKIDLKELEAMNAEDMIQYIED